MIYLVFSKAIASSTGTILQIDDISPLVGKDIISFAKGSNPIFIASVAFVFFFSLYGK